MCINTIKNMHFTHVSVSDMFGVEGHGPLGSIEKITYIVALAFWGSFSGICGHGKKK